MQTTVKYTNKCNYALIIKQTMQTTVKYTNKYNYALIIKQTMQTTVKYTNKYSLIMHLNSYVRSLFKLIQLTKAVCYTVLAYIVNILI